jgi:hypothetical protein
MTPWLLGVTVREYPEIEAGERGPDMKTFERMSEGFGWPRSYWPPRERRQDSLPKRIFGSFSGLRAREVDEFGALARLLSGRKAPNSIGTGKGAGRLSSPGREGTGRWAARVPPLVQILALLWLVGLRLPR